MNAKADHDAMVEHLWRTYLTTGENEQESRRRRIFKRLPGHRRCKNCYAPFDGFGSPIVKFLYGKRPSNMNPQLCNVCEDFSRHHQGGAVIELSMLFADVRGSTTLAEGMNPADYSRLIDRFYKAATRILVDTNALIDKIIGDQAAAMYVPGIAGAEHPRQAIEAAHRILTVTGHSKPEGPWIPLGVGVHTGRAWVGAIGSEHGSIDITVLGDAANIAARLSSKAAEGEILVSEATYQASGGDIAFTEKRSLDLKGRSEPVIVYALSPE